MSTRRYPSRCGRGCRRILWPGRRRRRRGWIATSPLLVMSRVGNPQGVGREEDVEVVVVVKEATMEEERRRKVRRGRRSREDSPGGNFESSPSQIRGSRLCFLLWRNMGKMGRRWPVLDLRTVVCLD